MTDAKVVMDNFMKRLRSDGYVKENQPNNGPEINTSFVEEQVESYTRLLKSGVVKKVLGK